MEVRKGRRGGKGECGVSVEERRRVNARNFIQEAIEYDCVIIN